MSERIPAEPADAARRRAIAALRSGEVVVLPTDSVYGLVGDAFNRTAMELLRRAKGRNRRLPFPVLLRSPRQVTGLVSEIPEQADRLMAAYWPGPLTLVLPATDGLGWDLGDTLGTVALRMPTDDLLLSVIAEIGPLACTGANRAGAPPVHDVDTAEEALGRSPALYIDGGRRDGPVSTIVDVTTPQATVLREAAVPAADVRTVASGELAWGSRPSPAAPGAPQPAEQQPEAPQADTPQPDTPQQVEGP